MKAKSVSTCPPWARRSSGAKGKGSGPIDLNPSAVSHDHDATSDAAQDPETAQASTKADGDGDETMGQDDMDKDSDSSSGETTCPESGDAETDVFASDEDIAGGSAPAIELRREKIPHDWSDLMQQIRNHREMLSEVQMRQGDSPIVPGGVVRRMRIDNADDHPGNLLAYLEEMFPFVGGSDYHTLKTGLEHLTDNQFMGVYYTAKAGSASLVARHPQGELQPTYIRQVHPDVGESGPTQYFHASATLAAPAFAGQAAFRSPATSVLSPEVRHGSIVARTGLRP